MDRWKNARNKTKRFQSALAPVLEYLRGRQRQVNMSGQVALVTGGSRGLGLLLARELAAAGCKLALCARDEAELQQAHEILTSSRTDSHANGAGPTGMPAPAWPPEVLLVPCDVTDHMQIKRMVDHVLERFGRIDILVNNAGIIQVTPLENADRADFESAMGTMFWGMYDLTMAVLPEMLKQGSGRIVNVTSLGGKISVPHLLPYSTAKFAATGFSEGLRAELASKNITVTTIVPGLMRTGSILNILVKGNKQAEFGWFAVLGSLPLLSMDAERAALRIMHAVRRGQAEAVIGLPAKLAVRANALFPNLAAAVAAIVDRMLPVAVGDQGRVPTLSHQVPGVLDRPLIRRLTLLSRRAASRANESPQESSWTAQSTRGTVSDSATQ